MTTLVNPRAGSPSNSEVPSDGGMDSLSKSDKALLKQRTPLNNNIKARYVSANDDYLPKTGLRGRKTFAFWTLVCLLFILAMGNLILTFTILGVLRLGQGMQSLELVPEASVIKFYGNTDLDRLYKRDGKLEGFINAPMEITGENGAIFFNLVGRNRRPENRFRMERNGTSVKGMRSFEIKEPRTGNKIFTTESPSLRIPGSVKNLNAKMVNSYRIASPIDNSLELKSGSRAHLRGNEGTNMESREIVWSADQDIYLKTINGSIVLSGKEGVSIDIKSIPIASGLFLSKSTAQYKVCVCMPQGKLFRVPVPGHGARVTCSHVNMSPQHNPCL